MANVKISNLPVAPNDWNLNEVLPIVDSGSTVTSKRTYGSLFSNHSGGTFTITATDQTWAIIASGSDSPQTHIRIGGINNAAVISSRGAEITSGQMNTIIGSEQENDSNQPKINSGQYNTIIGSKPNGSQLEINGANYSTFIGIENGYINGGNRGLIAASINSQLGYADNTASIATQGCQNNGSRAFIGGSEAITLSTNSSAVLASYGGTIQNGNLYQFVAGSYAPNISGFTSGHENMVQVGNRDCTVNHNGAGIYQASGRTSVYDFTLHTDNIHTFKTETFTETNGGNVGGAITVDCSQSTFYFFTMTADTSVNFTNVRDGQRFMFIVYNNGTFSVTGATVNGVSSTVYAKNGTINPTNNGYSKYVATYDSINGFLFLDEELGFSAV